MADSAEQTRVYVNNESQCPPDATLRQGPNGGMYYHPSERGRFTSVGGPKENTLFDPEEAEGDVEKTDPFLDKSQGTWYEFRTADSLTEADEGKSVRHPHLTEDENVMQGEYRHTDDEDVVTIEMEDGTTETISRDEETIIELEVPEAGDVDEEESTLDDETQKIFVGDPDEAPDSVDLHKSESGFFYERAWQHGRAVYPESLEEETDVATTDADSTSDGPESETEFDEIMAECRDRIRDLEEAKP